MDDLEIMEREIYISEYLNLQTTGKRSLYPKSLGESLPQVDIKITE